MKKNAKFICKYCGKTFREYASKKPKFCSKECADNSRRKKAILVCEWCGKEKKVRYASEAKKLKYCSPKCQAEAISQKIHKKCKYCGKKFSVSPAFKSAKYCSRECHHSAMRTNSNRTEADIIRKSEQYLEWRKSVFERDNFTCAICGKVGGKLNAHHIKQVKFRLDLILDIDNGITLCEKCHKRIHSGKGGQSWK